jgi:hypothetical protein
VLQRNIQNPSARTHPQEGDQLVERRVGGARQSKSDSPARPGLSGWLYVGETLGYQLKKQEQVQPRHYLHLLPLMRSVIAVLTHVLKLILEA